MKLSYIGFKFGCTINIKYLKKKKKKVHFFYNAKSRMRCDLNLIYIKKKCNLIYGAL